MDDPFTLYTAGVEQLLSQLRRDDPHHAEAAVLQARLEENIALTRRYGNTETRRAERAEIVDGLNRLALEAGVDFHLEHPSWPEQAARGAVLRDFLRQHWGILVAIAILEALAAGAYLLLRNPYMLSPWPWYATALLLLLVPGGWYAWGHTGRRWAYLPLPLLASLALAALLGWQAWQIAFPERFSPDVFGIAFAELGEGADYAPTARARELTGQVYEYLYQDLQQDLGQGGARRVELRKIGIVPDSASAQAYGRRIHAAIVIWGQVISSGEGGVTIRFQMIETPDRAIHPEFPIVLPVTTVGTDILARELDLGGDTVVIKETIARQAEMISSFILGLAAYSDRDYPQARAYFERAAQALESGPTGSIAPAGRGALYYYLGRAYSATGQLGKALSWLEQARQDLPVEPAVPLSLALAYGALGRDEERDQELDRSLALISEWLQTHDKDNAAVYDRSIIYEIRGQYEDAFLDLQAVIARDPGFYVAYIKLAEVSVKLQRFDQAEAALTEAVGLAEQADGNPTWAHLNLALLYEQTGRAEQARAEYERALALAPAVDVVHYYYARFLESQQEMDASWAHYRQLTEVSRSPGWAYGLLAGFLRRRGLLAQAVESYQLAVHAQPDDALLYTYMAETYLALDEPDKARQAFERAVALDQEIPYVYASYAGALFQWGDLAAAVATYSRSLALQPLDYTVLLNLGQVYTALGQEAQAQEIYCRVLLLAPHFPEEAARIARERLPAQGTECPAP